MLDGLLDNNTLLRPREHYTDTHGFTEQPSGLCYLLGFSFMPRLKDLKDQQLYRIERSSSHGVVDGLYRGTVDASLIREQYDAPGGVGPALQRRPSGHGLGGDHGDRSDHHRVITVIVLIGGG